MNKGSLKFIKVLVQLYWREVALWCAIQTAALFFVRADLIVSPFGPERSASFAGFAVFLFAAALGYGGLLLFFGVNANERSRLAWLYRLPVPEASFTIVPVIAFFVYGTLLYLTLPWGAFNAGLLAYLNVFPILGFFVFKKSRSLLLGAMVSVVSVTGLAVIYHALFFQWNVHQRGLVVDVALVLGFFCLVLLGSASLRETAYRLLAPLLLLVVMCAHLIRVLYVPAAGVETAILDLAYVESAKTIAGFKRVVVNPEAWMGVDAFSLPGYVRHRAQDFASVYLRPLELQHLFENVAFNDDAWTMRPVNPGWKMRPGLFPQPELLLGSAGALPVSDRIVTPELEQYIVKTWRNSLAYCVSLPFRKSTLFLDKIFTSTCGARRLYQSEVWGAYSLFKPGVYEQHLDEILTRSSGQLKISPEVLRTLPFTLFSTWRPRKDELEGARALLARDQLDLETLKKLKDRLREDAKRVLLPLAKMTKDEFYADVKSNLSLAGITGEEQNRYYLLCTGLFGSCDQRFQEWRMRPQSWWTYLQNWSLHPPSTDGNAPAYFLKAQLLDEAYWPRIEAMIKEATQT